MTGGVEPLDIAFDDRQRVALRIDGDEDDAQLLGVRPSCAAPRRGFGQRRRADIGAEGVAEEDEARLAPQIVLREGAALASSSSAKACPVTPSGLAGGRSTNSAVAPMATTATSAQSTMRMREIAEARVLPWCVELALCRRPIQCRWRLGVERLGAGRLAVARQRDLFDPRFGRLEQRFAMGLQRLAALVDGDRLGQRRLAAFELADDFFELRQRGLKAQRLDVVIGRPSAMTVLFVQVARWRRPSAWRHGATHRSPGP